MVKKRVHEIAKEINVESKEIISKLRDMGIAVKSHMSALENSEVERLLQSFEKEVTKSEKKPVLSPSVSHTQKLENKEELLTPENRKSSKTEEQQGERKKGSRIPEANYYRGAGLVDRVPSRPPDRRFEEKPVQEDKSPVRKAEFKGKDSQGIKGKDVGAARDNQTTGTAGRSQSQFQKAKNDAGHWAKPLSDPKMPNSRVQQEGNRHEGSPPAKQQQVPPAQDKGSQHSERGKTKPDRFSDQRQAGPPRSAANNNQGAGAQRWNNSSARPGSQPAGKAKPMERAAQVVAGPGNKIKTDSTAAAKPHYTDRPKPQDKSKPQAGRQVNKGRYDKRPAGLNNAGENKSRSRNAAGGAKKRVASKFRDMHQVGPAQPIEKKPIIIGESITVQELALKVHRSPAELIKKLMQLDVLATINQEIDSDTAILLASEFGYEVEVKLPVDLEALLMQEPEEDDSLLKQRPCIVTVMGHVDHGKTSLLDAIRQTNVIATEAGGITQHIGAYQVEHSGKKITFVDTPGHEAFTAMRARGAQVTDIAILVVAAEDGVMPQTIEAINHAQEAGVPIIVAINKMDKPGANPDRVKQELTEQGLIAEEWGGDTICVNVSAVNREGLKDLLEMILLVAEMRELKANPNRQARGTVIEAELDKGRGPVATVLVQNGTLNVGDNIIAGSASGRVRAMVDDKGRRIKKAGPSTPVEVLGFSETPMAGDVFVVVQDEKMAKSIVSRRQIRKREEDLKTTTRVSLDDLFKRIQEGQIKELSIIVKADVQGSVEVLRQALERLNTGEVKVNIIHGGVGAISETDIMLASASNAIIIGFNVRPDVNARKAAENEKVDVRLYRVIYEAIEDVKAAMSGLLDPEYKEVALGRAEVRKIFKASKIGTIAGCYVLEGKMERSAGVRLVRDGIVIHEGKLDSLKRFKDDVKEVLQGYECGLAFEKYNEMQEGDIVEAFTVEAVKRELA